MPTTTANLGLTLPTPNVDSGWGGTLNTDFTLIDDLFAAAGSGTSVGLQVGSGKTLNAGGTIIAGGTLILGSGDNTGTVTAPTIRGAARTGTNAAGANLTIDAANGTGTGGSGRIIFRTAAAGVSGSTANTMASRLEINAAGAIGVNGANYGSAKQVLISGGSNATPTWGAVDGTMISIPSEARGDILYRGASSWERLPAGTSGTFLRTNGAAADPSWQGVLVQSASQNFSGSAINFTGIPSTAKMITIAISGMDSSGGAYGLLRLGTSSGIVSAGYVSSSSSFYRDTGGGGNGSTITDTNSFVIYLDSNTVYGTCKLTNVSGNTWVCDHTFGTNSTYTVYGGGTVTLASALDRLQLSLSSGNFVASGSVSITYMG